MRRYVYHGSKFDNGGLPLVPGIAHADEETIWDGGFESNRFLYACSSASSALLLGISSMTEKELNTSGLKYDHESKQIDFIFLEEDLLTVHDLKEKLKDVTTYLYTILVKPAHGWVENKNFLNNIEGEYKTLGSIPDSDYVKSEIKVLEWLTTNNWKIITRLRAM